MYTLEEAEDPVEGPALWTHTTLPLAKTGLESGAGWEQGHLPGGGGRRLTEKEMGRTSQRRGRGTAE